MESQLGNVEIYPPSPQPPPTQHRRIRMLFDVPWIIILIQFILILALVLGLFAFFLTRSETPPEVPYSTRTYQNFELQTIAPSSSPLTFRRRYKTTSESPQSIDFDFSEDVAPTLEIAATTSKAHYQPSTLLESNSESLEVFEHEENLRAAVFTSSQVCSEIGKSILVRGGNAVDSAIAVSFCLMGALPNKASLAGGMMMTVKRLNGTAMTVMARESAPLNVDIRELQRKPELANTGSKATGTPGVLNGLFRAFQKFSSGRIEWKHLILPTTQQCVRGFDLPEEIANSDSPSLSPFFKANQQGSKLFCSSLAATLTEIAEYENPLDVFYRGEMAQKMVKELGGYLTVADLEDYESDVTSAICSEIDTDTRVCGPGPPSLFAVMVNSYLATKNMSNLEKVNEIVRSSLGLASKIGDPMFVKTSRKYAEELAKTSKRSETKELNVDFSENGSTEVLVIDENNMTASVTLSIGDEFGNLKYSTLGFFWNNKLKYFDVKNENVPLSVQPGKVPTSLASPIVIVKNDAVLAVSGGSDMLSLVHLLRDITHRNYDASKVAPALFVQNSAISLKSPSSKHSITGY